MTEHLDASQYGGDDHDAHRHAPVKRIMGGMLGVFGVFKMLFWTFGHTVPMDKKETRSANLRGSAGNGQGSFMNWTGENKGIRAYE
jgi:hypothetical protein